MVRINYFYIQQIVQYSINNYSWLESAIFILDLVRFLNFHKTRTIFKIKIFIVETILNQLQS
jgi:hypothetical protein